MQNRLGVLIMVAALGLAACAEKLPEAVEALHIMTLQEGTGAAVQDGQAVSVHYTGWLYDSTQPEGKGNKFDSSRDRGQPFEFTLGQGRVIKGWDQGVVGMRLGEQRRLIIPPDLAYGDRNFGTIIPANSTLMFHVELMQGAE